MSETIYCGNAKTIQTNYGGIVKLSLHKDDINRIVKYMKDNNSDWCNIDVLEKRNPEQGKPTHYLKIDTWKPDEEKKEESGLPQSESLTYEPDDSGLPF